MPCQARLLDSGPTSSWWPAGSSTYTSTSPWPALLVSTVNSARFFTMLPVGSMPARQGPGALSWLSGLPSHPSAPPPQKHVSYTPSILLGHHPIENALNWVN